jgi:hypothetical protein
MAGRAGTVVWIAAYTSEDTTWNPVLVMRAAR